jgi:hypothetical protein
MDRALGDCTGLSVLDLGGGNGVRARHAVNLGAIAVDVVDGEILSYPPYPSANIAPGKCV